jgi:hypothetical protein
MTLFGLRNHVKRDKRIDMGYDIWGGNEANQPFRSSLPCRVAFIWFMWTFRGVSGMRRPSRLDCIYCRTINADCTIYPIVKSTHLYSLAGNLPSMALISN